MTPGARVRFTHQHVAADLTGTVTAVGTRVTVNWDTLGPSTVHPANLEVIP